MKHWLERELEREGDPLSIINADLKYDLHVNGIKTKHSEYLITHYTDDTTQLHMLNDTEVSLSQALNVV